MSLLLRRRALLMRLQKFLRTVSGAPPVICEACTEEPVEDYKVYGNSIQDGTPTPDTPVEVESVGEYDEATGKYKIPVVAQGKNLFNTRNPGASQAIATRTVLDDNSFSIYTGNSTVGARYTIFNIPSNLLQNTKYRFSCILNSAGDDNKLSHNRIYIRAKKLDGAWEYIYYNGVYAGNQVNRLLQFTFNTGEHTNFQIYYYAVVSGGVELNNYTATLTDIQIEYGDTTTDFEPYTDETYTTNIYLNEPLRKVGGDADQVDFANGKVVRNIKEKVFDGTEDWYLWKTQSDGSISYALLGVTPVGNAGNRTIISNMFTYSRNNYTKNTIDAFGFAEQRGWVAVTVEGEFLPTLDDYKDFLSTQNSVGLPLKTYYQERFEEFIEFPQLPTLKGTTVYTVDTTIQPSKMEISYYSEEAAEDVL